MNWYSRCNNIHSIQKFSNHTLSDKSIYHIVLYIINNEEIYDNLTNIAIKNIIKKSKGKSIDIDFAMKKFIDVTKSAIKKYTKDFEKLDIHEITINHIAHYLLEHYQEEIKDSIMFGEK